jgi:hypothetical protein
VLQLLDHLPGREATAIEVAEVVGLGEDEAGHSMIAIMEETDRQRTSNVADDAGAEVETEGRLEGKWNRIR